MIESTTGAERAPGHSDRFFRLLFENSDEYAMVLLDGDGRITGWNRGAERLLGWSTEEALGEQGAIFFTEEDRRKGAPEQEINTALAKGRAEDTRWHIKKSGECFWASAVLEAVEDGEGNVVGFAKIIRDRTEVKRYEEALEKKAEVLERRSEQLEQSNQRLEAFASYVAHEMRSPLLGASLVIDALFERYDDVIEPEDLERAREVKNTLHDIKQFVADLLTYSRLDGPEEIEREPVQARTVVDEARADLRPLVEDRGANVEVGELPEVRANPTQLRHLFRNLLSNALTYNESEVPRVRVEAREKAQAWVFRVADNGVGISKDDQQAIFDLFERKDEGGASGIGVGLALTRRIVEAHGGEIWVESEPGQGTTFFFTIPKASTSGDGSDEGKNRGT